MSRSQSTVDRLGDDVFTHILSLSPISAVLAAGQTCKRLRVIATSRQTWLALISHLCARGMVDLPPGQQPQDLSKIELIGLAKRIHFGPQWSCQDPEASHIIHRATVALPEGKQKATPATSMDIQTWARAFLSRPPKSEDSEKNQSPVKLIPGGRYLLHLKSPHQAHIYDSHEGSLVWTYSSAWGGVGVKEFTPYLVDDGQGVVIVFILYDGSDSSRTQFVEVVHLSLRSFTSTTLYQAQVPDPEKTGFCFHPAIVGDRVVLESSVSGYCYLIDIGKQVLDIVDVSHLNRYKLALVPGFLISMEVKPGLEAFGLALHDLTRTTSVSETNHKQLATVLSETIGILPSSQGLPRIQLSVHACPLHHDVYHIWIFATYVNRVTGIFKYRLTLPTSGDDEDIPSLECLEKRWANLPLPDPPSSFEISYHGHVLLFDLQDGQPSILLLQDLLKYDCFPQWLDDSNARRRGHITAYSGVLAHGDIQDYEGKLEVEFYA